MECFLSEYLINKRLQEGCSVLITIATLLCYHADHLYRNVVKLLHDGKVLVLCESRIVLNMENDHDELSPKQALDLTTKQCANVEKELAAN